MQASFPYIQFFLVVGIGGGVPRHGPAGAISEMVLGDVVVSAPRGNHGGVVRYDIGAWEGEDEGRLNVVSHTNSPPEILLAAFKHLQMALEIDSAASFPGILKSMRLKVREEKRHEFEDQGHDHDRLFPDHIAHPKGSPGIDCQQCCDLKIAQQRQKRGNSAFRLVDTPKVHYGNIASSNQLQISAAKWNQIEKEYDVICFEMEGAGVIQSHPCLIVRGICDYSDSHKNIIWQLYAAVTAAAYVKQLLSSMPAFLPSVDSAVDAPASEERKRLHGFLSRLRITDPRDDKRRIEEMKGAS